MRGRGRAAPSATSAAGEVTPSTQASKGGGSTGQNPPSSPCIPNCFQTEISVP